MQKRINAETHKILILENNSKISMSLVVANASSGPTTITLTAITVSGIVTVKDSGSASGTNIVTIQAAAGNTFESGLTSYTLTTASAYISFVGNASTLKWRVLGSTYADIPVVSPVPSPPALGGNLSATLSNLSVISQAAFYSSVQIQGSLSVFSSITARNINFTGLLTSNGNTFSGAPAGINSAGSIGIGAAAGATTLLVTGTQSNTGTLGVASNITALRYTANGGNATTRTGGVYNRGNDADSSSYQSINWIPGDYNSGANWNLFDTTSQGAAGVFCVAKAGLGRIDFFVKDTPISSNSPDGVASFTSTGLRIGNSVGGNQWIQDFAGRTRIAWGNGADTDTSVVAHSSSPNVGGSVILTAGGGNRVFVQANGTTSFAGGAATINQFGAIVGASKNFKIPHPVLSNTTLTHASIEGPRYDLIYRNRKQLVNGSAEVDIEKESTSNGSTMTAGTFDVLATNPQVFLQNNDTFDRVKGYVSSHMLFIECENSNSSVFVDWMVTAERHDPHVIDADITDASGFLILENYISTISTIDVSSINVDLSTISTLDMSSIDVSSIITDFSTINNN